MNFNCKHTHTRALQDWIKTNNDCNSTLKRTILQARYIKNYKKMKKVYLPMIFGGPVTKGIEIVATVDSDYHIFHVIGIQILSTFHLSTISTSHGCTKYSIFYPCALDSLNSICLFHSYPLMLFVDV